MSVYYDLDDDESSELYHYGIMGMKWGLRRYQNSDGSLTAEGKQRYGHGGYATTSEKRHLRRDLNRLERERGYLIGEQYQADSNRRKYEIKYGKNSDQYKKWDARYNDRVEQQNRVKKYTNGLLKTAKANGVKVSRLPDLLETKRGRDYVFSGTIAALMAVSMAYLNPTGFGVGVGPAVNKGPDFVRGTNYRIDGVDRIKKYSAADVKSFDDAGRAFANEYNRSQEKRDDRLRKRYNKR